MLIGEAAVTNLNGICHVFAINTTDNDLEIELPPQEVSKADEVIKNLRSQGECVNLPSDFCRELAVPKVRYE